VVGSVSAAVAAQSKQLAGAADQILAQEPARVERFVPLTRPDAVLRYAADFLPSWAGAIALDLLPAVLVLILMAVHASIRRDEDPNVAENAMTANDMMQAMRLYDRMRREDAMARAEETAVAEPAVPDTPAVPAVPAVAERSEPMNVTPLSQRGRGEAG
jgi:hypothetical protein